MMHVWGNKLTVLTDLNEIKECKRHDGEGDSDRRVLISGKTPLEAGRINADERMAHRLPCEASVTTRNPFWRRVMPQI